MHRVCTPPTLFLALAGPKEGFLSMFKHFIITRFNLKMNNITTKHGETVLGDTWLSDRFELFERYCLPSIKGQNEQNFTWLVYFDVDTPQAYKDRVAAIHSDYHNFTPVYHDGVEGLHGAIKEEIEGRLDDADTHLISTRLDNDDALHADYVKTVQSYYRGQKYSLIDLVGGLSLGVEGPLMLSKIDKPANPFVSLIEAREGFDTVATRSHDEWLKHEARKVVKGPRLWLQVIHARNITNEFGRKGYLVSGGYLTAEYSLLDAFHIDKTIYDDSVEKMTAAQVKKGNLDLYLNSRPAAAKQLIKKIIGKG